MPIELWQTQVQVIPVVLAILLLEIPNVLRVFLPIPYVPIYFSLFPFNVLNQDLSIYLNDDTFYGRGEDLSEQELKHLKIILFQKAALAISISLGIVPFLGGFIAAFFLPLSAFQGFAIIFIAYKLIGIIRAAVGFHEHSISNWKSMSLYMLVYVIYFVCFLKLFDKSFVWTLNFVDQKNWSGLLSSILDLVVVEYLFSNIILGSFLAILIFNITNRKNRKENRYGLFQESSGEE